MPGTGFIGEYYPCHSTLFVGGDLPLGEVQLWGVGQGGGVGRGGGGKGEGPGDIFIQLPYTALPHGASPWRDFTQQAGCDKMVSLLPAGNHTPDSPPALTFDSFAFALLVCQTHS